MAEFSFFSYLGSTMQRRIFFVILAVVLLSQTVFIAELFMQEWTLDERRKYTVKYLKWYTTAVYNADISILEFPLRYNNLNGPQIWVETTDGDVVAGDPVKGFMSSEREELDKPMEIQPDIRIYQAELDWETGPDSPVELMVMPIYPQQGVFNLCFVYYAGTPSLFYNSFPWGLGILLFVGSFLSFIFAHYLAKPLRLLQAEVLAINRENLANPLTVRNPAEVADVTHAVNHLKSSLAQHIQSVHEMMVNVSHEMRSPLMRLTMAAAFIEDGFIDAQKRLKGSINNPDFTNKQSLAAKYLVYLKEDLIHMDKIVNNTLLSGKLDLQGEEDFAEFDLSRLCRDVLDVQSMLAAEKNLQFIHVIDNGIIISADETLIRQMMFNLLDNALKYSDPESSISVELRHESNRAVYNVRNPCPPLPEEKLVRLFDPFYRAGKIGGAGVGLGLSLVKKIVNLHGGSIRAEHTGTALWIKVSFPVKASYGERQTCSSLHKILSPSPPLSELKDGADHHKICKQPAVL